MIALVLVIIIVGVALKILLPARVFRAVTAGTVLVAVPLAVWNIRDLTELFVLAKHQRAYEQPLATDYDLLTAPFSDSHHEQAKLFTDQFLRKPSPMPQSPSRTHAPKP